MNEQKTPQEYSSSWHFWFLVSFSLLLIVVFVYWLPLRFLYEAEHGGMMGEKITHNEAEMPTSMHAEQAETVSQEEGDTREGLAVNLNVSPVPVEVSTSTRLDFFVNEKPGNVPIPPSDLEIEHTKLMHVIGVRSDLEEFIHIHPVPTEALGMFSVEHIFSKPGMYKFWSEVKRGGVNHVMGHPPFSVAGEGAVDEKRVSFSRNIIVRGYQVAIGIPEPVGKGVAYPLSFDIHTLTGGEVVLDEYLGALMHLTFIKDDWSEFIHTHPQERGHMNADDHHSMRGIPTAYAHGDEVEDAHGMPGCAIGNQCVGDEHGVTFSLIFPTAGLYKAFAQFRPAGSDLPPDEALTVSFWVRVGETGSAPPASRNAASSNTVWWELLAASLIAMAVISVLVHKYLKGV